jgi:hypothetical protein
MQPPDRLDEGVLGDPRQVQARPPRCFKDLPADVQAGRNFPFNHVTCHHMIPCWNGYLLPPEGNAEAVFGLLAMRARIMIKKDCFFIEL